MEKPFAGPVRDIGEASADFRFSAAVAGFGMILRDSENAGNFDLNRVVNMAKSAKGEDEDGYRGEFIRLVQAARDLHLVADRGNDHEEHSMGIPVVNPDYRK